MFATEIIEFALAFTDQQLYNIQNYEENGLIDRETDTLVPAVIIFH